MKEDDTADAWFAAQDRWKDEVTALRAIVRGTGLTETGLLASIGASDAGSNAGDQA